MTYTSVFGGNTIYPSDVSYLSIALSVDTPLEWPLESSGTEAPAARIIDVDPTASGFGVVLPDATLTGAGQTILFNNIDATYSFYIKDFDGNILATAAFGEQWQCYLAATTTAAGTWRVFRYGASTATVQPSALAGFGLTVSGSTLSQSLPVTTFNTTTTASTSNRAGALVWNATGTGTLNLLTAVSAGNNYFVFVRNEGGGDLTIDPSGSETINGAVTLTMRPGDSATLITDGTSWYTIGLGQDAVFAFDYTSISVTGGTVTLSGAQLNRIAYKFVGVLTSNCIIVVPSTIQQYWINNATTGAFTLNVKTSGGTPTQVNQGAKGIYYCDGNSIILGSDPTTLTTPIVVSDGGTGAVTASAARLNLGITSFADAIVTATTAASVRTTITAAASGANSDITSLTGLTTALSVAQGGTGQTTYTNGQLLIGNTTGNTLTKTTLTAGSGVSITNGTGSITIAAALTNWTEGVSTASPNATVPVVSFTATNAATNVDAAIIPKGTGALTAAIADSAATGGNKRGTYSVDWQTFRSAATQVASGAYSVVTGGLANTASGNYSVIGGGLDNIASGGTASAVLGGQVNLADASHSSALGGYNSTTRASTSLVFGQYTIANSAGVSQFRRFILGRQTTDATATVLASNISTVTTSNSVNLPANSAYYFKGFVIANVTAGGNTKGWYIEGVIKRGALASSTAIVGTATVTSNYADAGASTWAVTATANATLGTLAITVTGQAATTIRWVANIETTEVTF